jgi:hypothetical protein
MTDSGEPYMTTPYTTAPSTQPSFDRPSARPGEIDFLAIQRSPEFAVLRRRLRRFVFPMSAAFFGWYLCYVLLAA